MWPSVAIGPAALYCTVFTCSVTKPSMRPAALSSAVDLTKPRAVSAPRVACASFAAGGLHEASAAQKPPLKTTSGGL